jgi:hypothetical protein
MKRVLTGIFQMFATLALVASAAGLTTALAQGDQPARAGAGATVIPPASGTVAALRTRTVGEALIYLSGRRQPGDGGEGAFVLREGACRDDGIIEVADAAGKCFVRVGADERINVRWAGARGDGQTDDTAALLDAHGLFRRLVAERGNGQLIYPPGTYNTAATLPLPDQGSGWEVRGEGFPTIVETSDNVTLLRAVVAPGKSLRNFRISNLRLLYARPQPPTNRLAIGIALGCAADSVAGILDFHIENVVFDSAWRGIAVDPDSFERVKSSCPIWGFTIDSVTSYIRMSGATIWLATNRGGSPRGNLLNIYAQNKIAVEPAVSIQNMSNLYIRNMEFNLGQGTSLYLNNRENLIESIRFEQMSLADPAAPFIVVRGGQTTVNDLEVQSFRAAKPGHYYFVRSEAGSLDLHNLYTWGSLSSDSTYDPIDASSANTFKASGTWWRFKDAGVRFAFPGVSEVQRTP